MTDETLKQQAQLLQTAKEGREELEQMYRNIQLAAEAVANRQREVPQGVERQQSTEGMALEKILSEVVAWEGGRLTNNEALRSIKSIAMQTLVGRGRAVIAK
jgi:hypothetical protein